MIAYKPEGVKVPIKLWGKDDEYRSSAFVVEQAENLSKLPFAFHHIALMPDYHAGYGMPIGGVLATEEMIIVKYNIMGYYAWR